MPRLLVVDDEPEMRRSLAICLKREGHEVEEAAEGTKTLVHQERDIYDLIMTDRRMAPQANAGTPRAVGHRQAPGLALGLYLGVPARSFAFGFPSPDTSRTPWAITTR